MVVHQAIIVFNKTHSCYYFFLDMW